MKRKLTLLLLAVVLGLLLRATERSPAFDSYVFRHISESVEAGHFLIHAWLLS